jgi:hypothetical protein
MNKNLTVMKYFILALGLLFVNLETNAKTLITSVSQPSGTSNFKVDWGETDVNLSDPDASLHKFKLIYIRKGDTPITIDNIANNIRTYTIPNLQPGAYTMELIEFIRILVPPTPYSLPYIDVESSSGLFNISLNVPPVAVCSNKVMLAEDANCWGILTPEAAGAGSYDPNEDVLTYSVYPQGPYSIGLHHIELTVTDPGGMSDKCYFSLEVQDKVPPLVFNKNAVIDLNKDGYATLYVNDIDNGSFDGCQWVSKTISKTLFTCKEVGFNNVTLTVTDVSGNISTAVSVVEVRDLIGPYIGVKDMIIYLDKEGKVSLDTVDIRNNIIDQCGVKLVMISKKKFDCTDLGTQQIEIGSFDVNGAYGYKVVKVTVKDTLAPEIKIKAHKIHYLNATGQLSLKAEDVATASDNCSLSDFNLSKTSFTCDNLGLNKLKVFAEDKSGNKDSLAIEITIADTTKPIIKTKTLSTIYLDASGKASLSIEAIEDGSTDNCGIKTKTLSQSSFTCTDIGLKTIIYTVEDQNGNVSEKKIEVSIGDNIAPQLSLKSVTLSLDNAGNASLIDQDVIETSSDNCGIASIVISKRNFNCSDLDIQTITVKVKDAAGNETKKTVNIEIKDAEGVCLCTYAIVASERVEINGSTLANGGIGTNSPGKTVKLSNMAYSANRTFVKSDIIDADNSSTPKEYIKGVAPSAGGFEGNSFNDKKKLRVKKGQSETETGDHFKKVVIGKNGSLSFSAADVYIKKLKFKKTSSLSINAQGSVHVIKIVKIMDGVTINGGGKIYGEKDIKLYRNVNVVASLHSSETIEIKSSKADATSSIKGLLAASIVKSGENVSLDGIPTNCDLENEVSQIAEEIAQEKEPQSIESEETTLGTLFSFGPNPAYGPLMINLNRENTDEYQILVKDYQGRNITKSMTANKLINLDVSGLKNGIYYISIFSENEIQTSRLEVFK